MPDGTALDKALKIAGLIGGRTGRSPCEAIKRCVRETEGMSEVDGLARELEIGWPVFAIEDATEGPEAFAEKRPPNYTAYVSPDDAAASARKRSRASTAPPDHG